MMHNQMKSLLDETVPQEKVYLSERDKCWMTPLTKKIINDKWRAYREKKWTRFNCLKEKAKKEILRAKAMWAEKQRGTPHGLWKITKYISGKENKSELQNLITLCSSPKALAEKIAETINNATNPSSEKELEWSDDAWSICFTEQEVEYALLTLSPNKATGSDAIPNKIYSLLASFISSPLKVIFDTSISQRTFPKDWKKGIVVPIPKTNPPRLDKLRSITLLPSPSKILEKLVLQRIAEDVEPLFGKHQHAYRRGMSTTTALIEIHDKATEL